MSNPQYKYKPEKKKKIRVISILTAWNIVRHFIKFFFKVSFSLACLS